MRIGIEITGALGGGGYQRYAESLLKAFARMPVRHEYFLFGVFWRGFPERAHRIQAPRQSNFHWALKRFPQGLLFPLEEWFGLRFQEKALSGLSLDLVHGLGSLLPRLDRLRSVMTLHYAGPWGFEGFWNKFYFERIPARAMRQADRVIAISEFCRQEALKTWQLPPEKVVVVPHGDPGPEFIPAIRSEDPRPGVKKPYFLFVGGAIPQKNPTLLAEAFGRFRERHPSYPHQLVFAGRPGEETPRLNQILKRWKAQDRAVFIGAVPPDRIASLYQQAEAVICPSLQEGFAFPALEAMACGTPVIGVRAGALPETVGEAGLLTSADPEALMEAMARIVLEPGLREDFRRKGLERVRQFSWERTAQETLAIYEEVAGRG